MKEKFRHICAVLLTGVFVYFMLANTVFTHIHTDGTNSYSHSHPYLPNSNHSHNAGAASLIANFNLSSSVFEGTDSLVIVRVESYWTFDKPQESYSAVAPCIPASYLRGPPSGLLS